MTRAEKPYAGPGTPERRPDANFGSDSQLAAPPAASAYSAACASAAIALVAVGCAVHARPASCLTSSTLTAHLRCLSSCPLSHGSQKSGTHVGMHTRVHSPHAPHDDALRRDCARIFNVEAVNHRLHTAATGRTLPYRPHPYLPPPGRHPELAGLRLIISSTL